jgi:hypothetical protein
VPPIDRSASVTASLRAWRVRCSASRHGARSSVSASWAVRGQIGLKLYHWSGAAAIIDSRASAHACIATAMSRGESPPTGTGAKWRASNVPSGFRRQITGTSAALVRAAITAGPAGSVVHAPNNFTGTSSAR